MDHPHLDTATKSEASQNDGALGERIEAATVDDALNEPSRIVKHWCGPADRQKGSQEGVQHMIKNAIRRGITATIGGLALTALSLAPGLTPSAQAQGTLRVGMTLADIPVSFGQPDQGFEGFRFMGLMLYDALVNWDMTSADNPSGLIPGLAESWSVSEDDPTKWTFNLRKGVKFHDGSDFDADVVIFNFDKLLDKDSPQFSARQASLVNFRIPAIKSYRKVDDYTVEFTTHAANSFVPYQVCYILMASPAQWEQTGKDWNEFGKSPSGTGPWRLEALAPRERAEFVPFKGHWDAGRVSEARQGHHRPHSGPECPDCGAAFRSGGLDRGTGARRYPADRIARTEGRVERLSACLVLAFQPSRRLALERHPDPQGSQFGD